MSKPVQLFTLSLLRAMKCSCGEPTSPKHPMVFRSRCCNSNRMRVEFNGHAVGIFCWHCGEPVGAVYPSDVDEPAIAERPARPRVAIPVAPLCVAGYLALLAWVEFTLKTTALDRAAGLAVGIAGGWALYKLIGREICASERRGSR